MTHFTGMAEIPHASDLNVNHHRRPVRVARCATRWARQLLAPLCKKNCLDLLAKEKCIPLVMLGASAAPLSRRVASIVEDALLTFQRLYLLERRVRDAKLDFDWSRV